MKTVRMEEKGSANEDGLETGEQESARGGQGRKDERKTPVSRSDQWVEVATLRGVALLRCNGQGGVGGWGVGLEVTETASTLHILKLSKHWSPDFHGTLRQLLGN